MECKKIIGFFLLLILPSVHGATIMMITVFGSKSTTNNFQFIAENLVDRGHEIVFIMLDKTVKHSSPNITYITMTNQANFDDFNHGFFQQGLLDFYPIDMLLYMPAMVEMCRQAYDSDAMTQLLSYKGKIDLVIFDFYLQDCFLPAIHFLKAPIIYYHGNLPEPTNAYLMQVPIPYSYVQNAYYQPPLPMDFFSRVWSTFTHLAGRKTFEWFYYPAYEQISRLYLPHSPRIVDIVQNSELLMGSFDTAWGNARPIIPTVIDITCAHCRPPKPIPQDIERVIDESGEHGFIIFAMGTFFKAEFFPPGYLATFLKVFARLKQTVIWKRSPLKNLPRNVKTFTWLPQQDLFGHPKAKLYITHGGMYSSHEAIYHGIPMVGIGIFADQVDNLKTAKHKGIAVSIDRMNITEDNLYDAIVTVLKDPSYKRQVKKLSKIIRDQPTTPLQRALYGIEHVLKYGDASHLRGPSISLLEYYSIDVIACLSCILLLCLVIVYASVNKCWCMIKTMIKKC